MPQNATQFQLIQTHDKLNLKGLFSFPSGCRGYVLTLHGLAEHGQRFQKFGEALTKEVLGHVVFDYRGHGQSEGIRAHLKEYEDMLKDILTVQEHVRTNFATHVPYILHGNSFGGLLAVCALLRNMRPQPKALFLTSPCFGIPMQGFSKLVNRLLERVNSQFYYHNPIDYFFLSRVRGEIEKYKSDPLCLRKITAGFLSQLFKTITELDSLKEIVLDVPVYLFAGTRDRIVSLEAIQHFYRKLKCPHKALIHYPHHFHELFHEKRRAFLVHQMTTLAGNCFSDKKRL